MFQSRMLHLICTFLLISLQLQTRVHGAQASELSSNILLIDMTNSQKEEFFIPPGGFAVIQYEVPEQTDTYAESKESKTIRKKKKCNNCKKEHNNLKLCQGCFKTRYCNKYCQKRDWKAHRDLCGKPIKQYRELKIKWNKAHKSDPLLHLTRTSAKIALSARDGDLAEAEKYVQKAMYMFIKMKEHNSRDDDAPKTLDTAIRRLDSGEDVLWEADSKTTTLEYDGLKLKIQKKIAEKKEERCGKKYQNRRTKKRGKKR
eukprot:990956_1